MIQYECNLMEIYPNIMRDDLYKRLDDIQQATDKNTAHIDTMKSLVDDVLMSANNAIDSVETAVTVGGVIIALIAILLTIGLPYIVRKKTKTEVRDLVNKHLKQDDAFAEAFKHYTNSKDFKDWLQTDVKRVIAENKKITADENAEIKIDT